MISDKYNRISRNDLKERCQTSYIPFDLPQKTWQKLLIDSGFDKEKTAFGNLLGISCYLRKEELRALLGDISELWCEGSSICFDYPTNAEGADSLKNQELEQAVGEQMQALEFGRHDIKNQLLGLDIAESLETYIDDKDNSLPPFFAFGKTLKNREVYIKAKIRDRKNCKVFCVSFHFARFPLPTQKPFS